MTIILFLSNIVDGDSEWWRGAMGPDVKICFESGWEAVSELVVINSRRAECYFLFDTTAKI